jgi:hypothetical protein
MSAMATSLALEDVDARGRRGHKQLVAQPRPSEPDRPGVGMWPMPGAYRTLSSGLELHGRAGHQTVNGATRARHHRHHRPISTPNARCDSVTGLDHWGVLNCDYSARQFSNLGDCR